MLNLDSILEDASSFIYSEFNLNIEQSKLKLYSPENWHEFCKVNNFDANSEGLYVPASYSAYVRTDSPVLVSNVFHEYFGHGLFVEHSKLGKKLEDIIREGGNEKSYLFDKINSSEQQFGICSWNIGNYEGFAVWLEALLCEETNNREIWNLKKERSPKEIVNLFEFFRDAEKKLSRFGFMSQMGFPKYYTSDDVLNVLRKIYDSEFYNIDFIILYGSRKPESDIDLFVVSTNHSRNYFNGWLDIYELNRNEFYYALDRFDISVTDPLFSGKLIYGDNDVIEKLKEKILKKPITSESISYNILEAEKQKEFLKYFSEKDKRRKDCLSYIESFSRNAEQLKKGNKPLTLRNLKKIYQK